MPKPHFHVAVFHMKQNQITAEHRLRNMGLEFETFPMGRTLIKNMTEEQFEEWVEPYQGRVNTEEDPAALQDFAMFDDEAKAREAADWLQDGKSAA